jgi:hypothetical protein
VKKCVIIVPINESKDETDIRIENSIVREYPEKENDSNEISVTTNLDEI